VSSIVCPQCGMTNHPDDITYPRCNQCNEDLVRCPACRHFEAGGCHHPREAARYTPDGEAAKSCPSFRSRNELHDSSMQWNVPAPVWVSTLLLVILVGLCIAAWFIDPTGRYFRGNPLRLETMVPSQVMLGQQFYIKMRITNLMDRNSTRLYVEVGDEFLANALPGMPAPTPARISRTKNHLLLEYDPLPKYGWMTVLLPFTPMHKGAVPFTAKIYAPSNQLRQIVNTPPIIIRDPGVAMLEGDKVWGCGRMGVWE